MPKTKKKIRVGRSGIHARGVYADAPIQKGERCVEYTGRRLTHGRGLRSNSEYLYELNNRTFIDGRNIARYINHSCDPNCESDVIRGKIWIIAIRDIAEGEELTYNYRFDFEEALKYPCLCGTRRCAGYIAAEDEWPKLRRKALSKARRKG